MNFPPLSFGSGSRTSPRRRPGRTCGPCACGRRGPCSRAGGPWRTAGTGAGPCPSPGSASWCRPSGDSSCSARSRWSWSKTTRCSSCRRTRSRPSTLCRTCPTVVSGFRPWDRALSSQSLVVVGAPLYPRAPVWPKLELLAAVAPLEVVCAGSGSVWVAAEDAISHCLTAADAAASHSQAAVAAGRL